jgi:hypothetical protein
MMHTAKIQITPKLATEWLKQNTNNIRAILLSKVDLYAGMMSRDKWTLTHQGIAFDELDNLIDGQHRLKAIVKSNKTITCNVSFGVQSSVVPYIDRGLKRTAAVVLGEDKRCAEIISFITRILYGASFGDDEILRVRDNIILQCNELVSTCGTTRKGLTAASIRAAFVTAYIETGDCEVLSNYRRYVLLNVGEEETVIATPTSLRVLHNRISTSRLRLSSMAAFGYAYRAIYSPDSKKLSVSEDQLSDLLASIRKFYRRTFNL